jgi:hypothetical protein
MSQYPTAADATPSRRAIDGETVHYWMTSPEGQVDMHVASVASSAPETEHDAAIAAGLAEGEAQGCDWTDWDLSIGSAP